MCKYTHDIVFSYMRYKMFIQVDYRVLYIRLKRNEAKQEITHESLQKSLMIFFLLLVKFKKKKLKLLMIDFNCRKTNV
jgi:hypothetical protein